jgi:hypothetical protein
MEVEMSANDRLATLCAAVDIDRLRDDVEWFGRVRRDTGGEGEERAAAYIADRLADAGVPVDVHAFDAFLSYPREARFEARAADIRAFACVTHAFAQSTPPGGLVGRLVDVADDAFERARGEIALVDGLATPVTLLRASRAGCAGVVFTNQDEVVHNMIGTTIWGTPGIDDLDRLPRAAAVSVNRSAGAWLRARLSTGQPVEGRLDARVDTGWFRSKLPEVRLEGRSEGREFVLAGGHYCAWDVGVTDNATGDACLMEMARLLWRAHDELGRGVRLCWWPGHSHGRYSGSTWYADAFFADLAEYGIAYYNIDSPGVRGATRYVARHTCAELEDYCRSVIGRVTGQVDAPVHRPSRAADQSFLANGVPSFSAYPFLPDDHPDRRPWTGGSANAWWWHTDADTLDKADIDVLATDVRVGLTAVWGLVAPPLLPLDYRATADELSTILVELAATAGGHLDLSPLVERVRELRGLLDVWQAAAAGVATSPFDARRWNAATMRLGRLLNPVVYSRGGRFVHDPAEWSPIMRASKRFTLPGLSRAAGLPALAGTSEYGFLRAQCVRELNRTSAAVADALASLRAALGLS